MLIDCDSCQVRGDACSGCVMTVLLGITPGVVEIDATERRALDALAGGGLVPPLRLVLREAEAG
jgi:hypothetical protein